MTHVLMVDDPADIREILRELLEEEGSTVSEASNGVEGLAALRALPARSVVL